MEQNAVIIVDTLLLTKGAKLLNNSSCDSKCCVWSHMLINKDLLLECTHYPMQR